MLRKAMFVVVLTLGLTAGTTWADTLIVNGITAEAAGGEMPASGITKARVTSGWGEPKQKSDAIGEPPISRWDYGNFVVYFEYDHVIHAVLKR
jgi:hypothetical protein